MGWWDTTKRIGAGVATGGLSEVNRYMGNQAAKGGNTAAAGADASGRGYAGLAGEMQQGWNSGANTALGMYRPSQDLWAQTYAGQGPGAGEQFYSQYGGQYQSPTESSRVLGNYQQGMGQMGANFAMGAANAQSALGQPSAQSGVFRNFSQQMGQPGRTADAYGQSQQMNQNPGAYENWAGGANAISSQQNQRANTRNASTFDQSQQAGRSEAFNPTGASRMQQLADNLGQMQGTNQTNAAAGEVQNYARGAGQASDYYGSQQRALQAPGVYEQFVQDDIYGRNPAHERALSEGMGAINSQMAKRGAFNSGAAMTGLGNFVGKMEAEDYQNRSNRAAQAQGMQMGRIAQGTQSAQAASQNRLAQGSALQGLAGQRDNEQRARVDQSINANNLASGEQLASQRLGLDAAGQSDRARMDRLRLGLDTTAQDHAQGIAGLRLQGDINQQSQQFGMDRGNNMVRNAGMADQSELARMMGGFNMSQGVDADALKRIQMGYDIDQSQYDGGLARYNMWGNLAGQQDQQTLSRLNSMGQQAFNAQQAQQQRYGQAFDSMYGMNKGMADLYAEMYGQGMNAYGENMGNSYNAYADAAGLRGDAQNARAATPFKLAQLGIDGFKAVKGR